MSDPFVPTTDKTSDEGGGIDTGNVDIVDYKTQGKTVVSTLHGYEFASENKALPRITPEGVTVTRAEADELVDESDGLVRITKEEDDS